MSDVQQNKRKVWKMQVWSVAQEAGKNLAALIDMGLQRGPGLNVSCCIFTCKT